MSENKGQIIHKIAAEIGLPIVCAAYKQINGYLPESSGDLLNNNGALSYDVNETANLIARKMRAIILKMDLLAMSRPPEDIVNELYSLSTQVEALQKTIAQLRSSPEYTMGCALLTFARIMKQQ